MPKCHKASLFEGRLTGPTRAPHHNPEDFASAADANATSEPLHAEARSGVLCCGPRTCAARPCGPGLRRATSLVGPACEGDQEADLLSRLLSRLRAGGASPS